MAVLEHLYDPFRATAEIARVLAPGGAFVGSVAFLEPFHARSYFHMTHLGLEEVLRRAGFEATEIQPGWSFTEALASFWPWNLIGPVRGLSRRWNRMAYRVGMALWRGAYAVRGKPLPRHILLGFQGSLVFRATRPL